MSTSPAFNNAEQLDQQRIILTHAAGECLMAWAQVEFELSLFFSSQLTSQSANANRFAIADSIWATIISFEARLKMLNAVVSANIKDQKVLSDWRIISSYITNQNTRRNQIAHSDIHLFGKEMKLQPFPTNFISRKPALSHRALKTVTGDFIDLAKAISWLMRRIAMIAKPSLEQVASDRLRTPVLVLRLRKQAAQSRGGKRQSLPLSDRPR